MLGLFVAVPQWVGVYGVLNFVVATRKLNSSSLNESVAVSLALRSVGAFMVTAAARTAAGWATRRDRPASWLWGTGGSAAPANARSLRVEGPPRGAELEPSSAPVVAGAVTPPGVLAPCLGS